MSPPGQKIAYNNGQKIHYKTAGKGVPVVLLFGFGMSLEEWFGFGYADEFTAKGFQVLAIEPRGHGNSSCPVSADEYTLKKLAKDVAVVLDEEDIERVHIFAYSLGAKIALGIAENYPARIISMGLGGFEIASKTDLSNDIVSSTLQQGGKHWRRLWESLLEFPSAMKKRLETIHPQALIALRQQETRWNSFEFFLKNLKIPVFLFAGEHCFTLEDMKKANHLITNSTLFILPEQDHFTLIGSMKPAIEKSIRFIASI